MLSPTMLISRRSFISGKSQMPSGFTHRKNHIASRFIAGKSRMASGFISGKSQMASGFTHRKNQIASSRRLSNDLEVGAFLNRRLDELLQQMLKVKFSTCPGRLVSGPTSFETRAF